MGVVFSRLLQTVKLERDAFVWMDFNDRASGDAAILVVMTQVLIYLGRRPPNLSLLEALLAGLNPILLIQLLLTALFSWVFYSGAVYAVSRFLLDGSGQYAIYMRITGFAAPTLLLFVFTSIFISNASLAFFIGGAWFIVVVANGLTYTVDIPLPKAVGAAIGGFIAVVIAQAIFGSIF